MADKKITALTSMGITDAAGEDFLHIIDYGGGSSPVNKKVSLTNLFSQLNLDTTIYGASKTFEIGFGLSSNSAFKVATAAAANADATVTINDDGNAFTDFLIKSDASDSIFKVDAGANTVTINGDSANADFIVNGDTVANMIHVDGSADAVGVGKVPHTDWTLDVAATGTNAIKAAGKIEVTGEISATTNLTVGGLVTLNNAQGSVVVGTADGTGTGIIPITTLVSYLSAGVSAAANDEFSLADGVTGQIKILILTAVANSATAKIQPTNMDWPSGHDSIQLNDVGETVMLIFHGTKWYQLGAHTGTVTGAA